MLTAKRLLLLQADRLGMQALLPPIEGLGGAALDRSEADAALEDLLNCVPVCHP